MRKVLSALFFTLVLLFSTICFAGNDDYPRVAVLDFTNKAKANKSVVLDKLLAAEILATKQQSSHLSSFSVN